MSRLEEFATNYRAIEAAYDQVRGERDKEIRRAYAEGLPLAEIAHVLRLSHQHVSRIVRGE